MDIFISIIISVITGIITGVISGIIMNVLTREAYFKRDFELDKRRYAQWLNKINSSLSGDHSNDAYSMVLWTIDDEPIITYFDYLVEADKDKLHEMEALIEQLKWAIIKKEKMSETRVGFFGANLNNYAKSVISFKTISRMERLKLEKGTAHDQTN